MRKIRNPKLYQFPKAAFLTDKNDLALPLVNKLIKKLCKVDIISDEKSYWRKEAPLFVKNLKFLNIINKKEIENNYNYMVCINLYQALKIKEKKIKKDSQERIELAIDLAKRNSAKSLFVFPYIQKSEFKNQTDTFREKISKDKELAAGIVFLGQLIGPEMDFYKDDLVAKILKDARQKTLVKIPEERTELYPISINKTADELVKTLFSFGALGKEKAIISYPVSTDSFFKIIKNQVPNLSKKYSRKKLNLVKIEVADTKLLRQNTASLTRKTLRDSTRKRRILLEEITSEDFKQYYEEEKPKKEFFLKRKRIEERKIKKWLAAGIYTLAIFILFPALMLSVSLPSLFLAKENFEKGNLDIAKGAFYISKTSSQVSKDYLSGISKILKVPWPTYPLTKTFNVVIKISDLGLRKLFLTENFIDLFEKINKDEAYDVSFYSEAFSVELDFLYREIGFLQGELSSFEGVWKNFFNRNLKESVTTALKEKILLAKSLSEELPLLLGKDSPKTYAVLFQNNFKLRPTGGLLESFVLLSFNQGRLVEIEVFNTDLVDERIKGEIEPPYQLKKYLKKDRWLLKDFSWDPDFTKAAQQFEWFLDMGLDKKVDGVIAIDFEQIREVLRETGPLSIDGLEEEINERNVYEVLKRMEANSLLDNSLKGSSLMKEISKKFVEKLFKLSKKEKIKVFKSINNGLEEKHIQIFLHDIKVQREISDVGWDGAVLTPTCLNNCMSDWLGVVEADFSEGGFIERKIELELLFEEGVVKRELLILLKNEIGQSFEDNENKLYIRVLAPAESSFSPIVISDEESKKIITPEIFEVSGRKEAGIFFELGLGKTKSLLFSWESPTNIDFGKEGEYRLYWRKQAGTIKDPIKVKFIFPKEVKNLTIEGLTLSPGLGYNPEDYTQFNAELSRDFVSRIYW